MTAIHFILHDGSRRTVQARDGRSVMEAALQNNVRGIDAECGGSCSCATCHVYVDPAFIEQLDAPDAMEAELLDATAAPREAGSRLACQIPVRSTLEGLVVRVPATQA